MALTWRQRQFYRSRVKVYRAGRSTGADKEVSDSTFAVVPGLTSVPALYFYTQNDSDKTGVGRTKRRSALTEDGLKVEVSVGIRSGDLVVDVTLDDPNYGTVHRIMGQPRLRPSRGGRLNNERVFQIFQEEKPPAEVVP